MVLRKLTLTLNAKIAFANATRKFARDYEANEAEYDKKKLFDPRKFLADGVKLSKHQLKNVSTYSVQKVKLNLAEPYKMKPACEGGFCFWI